MRSKKTASSVSLIIISYFSQSVIMAVSQQGTMRINAGDQTTQKQIQNEKKHKKE